MNFVSIKDAICYSFAGMISANQSNSNKAFFLTPIGFVSGFLASDNEQSAENSAKQTHRKLLEGARAIFKKSMQQNDVCRAPHDDYILLQDVEIQSLDFSQPTVKFESFVLFTDTVVGAFFGQIPRPVRG